MRAWFTTFVNFRDVVRQPGISSRKRTRAHPLRGPRHNAFTGHGNQHSVEEEGNNCVQGCRFTQLRILHLNIGGLRRHGNDEGVI